MPEQLPVQPENVYPAAGVASNPIGIEAGIVTEHSAPPTPQLNPAPATVPPVGTGLIVIVNGAPVARLPNVAVHSLTPFTATVVVRPVPEQLPPQLVKE